MTSAEFEFKYKLAYAMYVDRFKAQPTHMSLNSDTVKTLSSIYTVGPYKYYDGVLVSWTSILAPDLIELRDGGFTKVLLFGE